MSLRLRNRRVCWRYAIIFDPQLEGITLDAVASTGLRTMSRPLLLIVAAILTLLAIGLRNDQSSWVLVIGAVLVLIYFLTRRRNIVVESKGGLLMRIPALDLSLDDCYFIINSIDRSKLEFLRKVPEQP